MRSNPVFREGVQLYLTEGHSLIVYWCCLLVLALIEFLVLFLPALDPQAWMGPANLFKLSSMAAILLIVYSVLRIMNQEFVPWRFITLRGWLRQEGVKASAVAQGQIALLCLHALLLLLLSAPLLIWAGAIARAPLDSVLFTLSVLLFYALSYGVWALVAAVVWERKIESRQVFVRCLFISAVLLSGLFYAPLSPIAFVFYHLGRREMAPLVLWGWKWSAPSIHFLAHFFLLGAGLFFYRWTLHRREAGI